jgi:hypothetical protein
MALIRMTHVLVALLLVAVAAPAAGATVRPAAIAGPSAPVVAVAPPVAAHTTGAVSAPVAVINDDEDDDPQALPAEDLLNPDGTLRPDGTFNGAVDISGWNVTLDPDNGPVFSPQALTYTWENLGTGVEGLLNGSVYAIAISGTDVFVGGSFTNAGGVPGANRIARWDGTQWHAVGGANAISGPVYDIALSGTDVYVGGFFFNAGGVPGADYIARWNGTTWSGLLSGTFGISNTVNTIAISGTDVYVGGNFTNAGGVPGANNIARWDGANNTWNLVGGASAINNFVKTIAISGTDVYVGGNFTSAGSVSGADYIARWDGTNWSGLLSGTFGISNTVNTIAISGTDVYVGGAFINAGGVPGADYIARWNSANNTWNLVGGASAISGFFPFVGTIVLSGTDVYVGGFFTNAGNVPGASYIARWNSANNTWNLVGAANAINAAVQDIKVSGSSVYIGGQFTNAGGNNANDHLTRWTGSAFVPPGSETTGPLNGTVSAVVVSGTEVYVGGSFTNAGNVPGADYIARWNGTTWSGLLSGTFGIGNTVNTIALSGTDVLVGGVFTNAGGVPGANNIARWDGANNTWNLVGGVGAINGFVNTIAISGTDVYVGGLFTGAGGVSGADHIARWNGTTWSGLLSGTFGISSTVTTIAISGTEVYVGGNFTGAGGVTGANYIARWNSANSTWNRLGAPNAINNSVTTIAISGTEVYVGGDFTDAGGVPGANYIARWNSANNTWNLVGAANAVNSTVRAIKVSGSDVYIGGDFTNAGGNSAADYLVRWDGAQWTALVSGTAGVFGPVYALAVPSSDDVYVGGNFLNTGNNPFADYIARYALATKRVYLPLIVR